MAHYDLSYQYSKLEVIVSSGGRGGNEKTCHEIDGCDCAFIGYEKT